MASQTNTAESKVIPVNNRMTCLNASDRSARVAVSTSVGSAHANANAAIDPEPAATSPRPPSRIPYALPDDVDPPSCRVARINADGRANFDNTEYGDSLGGVKKLRGRGDGGEGVLRLAGLARVQVDHVASAEVDIQL